jgi:ATP-dependent DNA ligase
MSAPRELQRQLKPLELCLPRPAEKPLSGPGWIHEIKHDGLRILAERDAIGVALHTRGRLGCEGIVSKRLGSSYRGGRASCWIKLKNLAAPAVAREAEEQWGR